MGRLITWLPADEAAAESLRRAGATAGPTSPAKRRAIG
jgi:hypothetical protein